MCLAVPAKVVARDGMMATVEVDGVRREISLMLLPDAEPGSYILMHAGFAVQSVDEAEARATGDLLKELKTDD